MKVWWAKPESNHSCLAPVIARASGTRRAGQGRAAAKRTLDAPKRSRTIGHRSDRKPGRDHSWKVGRNPRPEAKQFLRFLPEEIGAQVRADSPTSFPRAQHARLSTSPTLTWGVSDPAGRLWGRGHSAQAGSLTSLPCCDTCAGALIGRHKPPPVLAPPGRRQHRPVQWIAASRRLLSRWNCTPAGKSPPLRDGGPTAPWRCVPLLGPLHL